MADNVAITAGSGTPIATDDVVGVHYQRVKLVNGALDATDPIGGDATNGLDVDVTRMVPGTGATALGKAVDGAVGATDTGVAALAQRADIPGTLTPVDGDYVVPRTDANGRLWVNASSAAVPSPSVASASVANVPASAASTTLAASNANRKGLSIFNDSSADLYVKFGATASTTSFTLKLGPGSFFHMAIPIYTGVIDGIWSAADGAARVTEF